MSDELVRAALAQARELYPRIADLAFGHCHACDADTVLMRDHLGQALCPSCSAAHDVAAKQVANWLADGVTTVRYRGERVDLLAPTAWLTVARNITDYQRRRNQAAETKQP